MLVCSSSSSGSGWHSYDACSLNSNHKGIVFMGCIEFLEMHMEGDLIIDGRLKREGCMLTLFFANRKETATANTYCWVVFALHRDITHMPRDPFLGLHVESITHK